MMETLTPPGKLVAAVGITCLSAACDACEQAHPSSRELDSWTDDDVLKGGNPIDLYQFAGSTGNEIIKVRHTCMQASVAGLQTVCEYI